MGNVDQNVKRLDLIRTFPHSTQFVVIATAIVFNIVYDMKYNML